ncbi:MAG: CBS domain-containing protein [Desulfurococcales archaeon]|nr:CBS domain-containing protein [Desulfurococcales archaeon]
MDVPVVSLVGRSTIVMREDDTVSAAIEKMSRENVGSVVIVDDSMKPIGIFTERDLLMRVCARGLDPSGTRLRDVMTRNPLTIRENETVRKALDMMIHFGFRHLPVVDPEGRLVGVISIRDLSRALASEVDVEELHSAG